MLNTDADAFDAVMQDLCLAFNRPHTVELTRVYWESMKHLRIDEVRRTALAARNNLKKFPTPKDLIPDRPAAAPPPRDPIESEEWSSWAMAANQILLAVAYFDERRGFKSIAKWEPTPERGWGLPLRRPRLIDGALLDKCLAIKRDFVRMAEEAQARGDRWDTQEFNRMCREGFEQVLGTPKVAA